MIALTSQSEASFSRGLLRFVRCPKSVLFIPYAPVGATTMHRVAVILLRLVFWLFSPSNPSYDSEVQIFPYDCTTFLGRLVGAFGPQRATPLTTNSP